MKVVSGPLATLLQNLIQQESPDPPGNEKKVAEYVAKYLKDRGVDVEWDEHQPGRVNIIAWIGTGEKSPLIFSAHMDTMSIGTGKWQHDPYGGEQEGERIYGRGASDMKSSLASMITAFLAIKEKKLPLKGRLILALSAGESSSGIGAKRFIEKGQLKGAGACLVGEPSSMKLFRAEKGAVWLGVKFAGRSGHSSGEDLQDCRAVNAIELAQDFTHRLKRARLSSEPHPLLGETTWSVNQIMGGTVVNMVPDSCEVKIDVRTLPNQKAEEITDFFHSIVDHPVEIEVLEEKEPVETPPDDPFVLLCKRALESVMNTTITPEGVSYFSDASILCPALKIPMVIIGAGELGQSGMQDEWATTTNMELAARTYYKIAKKYLT